MSKLTELSAIRLQEALLLQSECARCGHPLREHPLSVTEGTRCHHWDHTPHPKGYKHGNGKMKYCHCKAFVDADEVLV